MRVLGKNRICSFSNEFPPNSETSKAYFLLEVLPFQFYFSQVFRRSYIKRTSRPSTHLWRITVFSSSSSSSFKKTQLFDRYSHHSAIRWRFPAISSSIVRERDSLNSSIEGFAALHLLNKERLTVLYLINRKKERERERFAVLQLLYKERDLLCFSSSKERLAVL